MSATGRSNVRRADDFYSTPEWCTRAILTKLRYVSPGYAIDPCCGDGAILNEVAKFPPRGPNDPSPKLFGIELDTDRALRSCGRYQVRIGDALGAERWPSANLLITNPPYSLAEQFIRRAAVELPNAERAFLLRLDFLGAQKRAQFHRSNPSDVYVLPRRPSFTENGKTDATEYAWFVWGPDRGGRWEILNV